jgi:hypothetical protein
VGRETDRSVRRRRLVVTVIVLLAVVSPALRDRDSFPLSTYPMYASARPDATAFPTVAGFDGDGAPVELSLAIIAETDDALIGRARVAQRIEQGAAAGLCAEVAGRAPADVARVEVVTELHDVVAQASGEDSLVDRSVHARCEGTE